MEPDRVYSIDSPYSFFRDLEQGTLGDRAAVARLDRYDEFLNEEIRQDSPEGRAVLDSRAKVLRSASPTKTHDERVEEARAMTSSSAVGWTTPQYIVAEFALYRGGQRAFVDNCMLLPMPDVGLAVHIPSFTAAASAGISVEGTAISSFETDPTSQDNTTAVVTLAGQVITSQQTVDRGNLPGGFSFDLFVYAQLRENYDQTLDQYVLQQAIQAGIQVTPAVSTPWITSFYSDLRSARELMEDTVGNRIVPTHVFSTPDLFGYLTNQVDDQHRPILIPMFSPGNPLWPDDNVQRWEQFSGVVLPGNLMQFMDPNIPVSGSNTRVIVTKPDTIAVWNQETPIVRAFPQTLANNLQVVLQMYGYAAAIPRFPKATAVITGSNYALTNV